MSKEKVLELAAVQGVPLDAVAEYLRNELLRGENIILLLGVRVPFAAAHELYQEINGLRN